jgi:BirA family biotin operon repressor/biotin-[acetyl-CoA-carboxylase] ligase
VSGVPAGIGPDLRGAHEIIAEYGGSLGHPIRLIFSTSSTNDEAKRGAKYGAPHGATWVAEQQTAGRGRQGRAWWSSAGESLLFSVLVRDAPEPARLPQLALAAGLAVHGAIARQAPGAEVKIKWPNDVLVDKRKVGGVLVEAITAGSRVEAIVVGVGINVHTRVFPNELALRATSIALHSPGAPDRAHLLADILATLDGDLHVVRARGLGLLGARLSAADALRGHRVRTDAGESGIASGIDDEGCLLVRGDDGVLSKWFAGEVHLVE